MNGYIKEWFDKEENSVIELSDELWSNPEVSYKEYHACEVVSDFMRKQGFKVSNYAAEDFKNPDARPNTVIATWGEGRPIIGILGEMDGLPGLGQQNVPYEKSIAGPGHGCGHNLIGGGCVAAASALKNAMEKEGLSGTIKLVDCPAEEVGSGKVDLAKNGVFSDMDVCLSYHPDNTDFIFDAWECQAIVHMIIKYSGKSSHAAMAPWKGRSALDAAELMNIGVQYLREHITQDCSLHYVYRHAGDSPNIVPNKAILDYYIRASDENLDDLLSRVLLIVNGAAMMTETKAEWEILSGTYGFIPNIELNHAVYNSARKIPPLEFTDEEYDFASIIYQNVMGKDAPKKKEDLLPTKLKPPCDEVEFTYGSTDVADVSHIVPVMHLTGSGRVKDLPSHHWSVTSVSGMSIGHKAMIYGYKIIAQAGYDLLTNPEVLKKVKEEFSERNGKEYIYKVDRDYSRIL